MKKLATFALLLALGFVSVGALSGCTDTEKPAEGGSDASSTEDGADAGGDDTKATE